MTYFVLSSQTESDIQHFLVKFTSKFRFHWQVIHHSQCERGLRSAAQMLPCIPLWPCGLLHIMCLMWTFLVNHSCEFVGSKLFRDGCVVMVFQCATTLCMKIVHCRFRARRYRKHVHAFSVRSGQKVSLLHNHFLFSPAGLWRNHKTHRCVFLNTCWVSPYVFTINRKPEFSVVVDHWN